ncbi:MAG: hypothetical protein FWB75_03075 [Oscillospiraceae bacterium]|nr:hypothetical protein [Oscillospiraceae bacterium]
MLNNNTKKEALAIHERAVNKYNGILGDVQKWGLKLYELRKDSIIKIEICENLINSIANTPKEINAKLVKIEADIIAFRNTENYAQEACQSAIKSGVGAAVGVGAGATVAALAPTAAMWVATTFGTASTGTAIASLSGAVATKAALAWLGGGAIAAGGAGVAGGQALLALAGPIGWGIAAAVAGGNMIFLGSKNKKIANQAIDEAKTITFAGAQLKETGAKIEQLIKKTESLLELFENQIVELRSLKGHNYSDIDTDKQLQLGTLVNNALSLSELLNKTVN